jgi:hypothetical protein
MEVDIVGQVVDQEENQRGESHRRTTHSVIKKSIWSLDMFENEEMIFIEEKLFLEWRGLWLK